MCYYIASVYHYAVKEKGKAQGKATCRATAWQWWWHRHGSVVSATGKKKVKVVAELSREEEQQMVDGLKNTYTFYNKKMTSYKDTSK